LSLESLVFTVPEDFRSVKVFVMTGTKPIKIDYMLKDGRLDITLKNKLILTEDEVLKVIIHR
jgi:hypothetical protein